MGRASRARNGTASRRELHFEQAEPGLWLPREIELQSFAPIAGIAYPEQYRGKLTLSTRIRVTRCNVNRVADDVFASPTKRGDWVVDFRQRPTGRFPFVSLARACPLARFSGEGAGVRVVRIGPCVTPPCVGPPSLIYTVAQFPLSLPLCAFPLPKCENAENVL